MVNGWKDLGVVIRGRGEDIDVTVSQQEDIVLTSGDLGAFLSSMNFGKDSSSCVNVRFFLLPQRYFCLFLHKKSKCPDVSTLAEPFLKAKNRERLC